MRDRINQQRQNLIKTLQRMHRQALSRPAHEESRYSAEYAAEIAKYENMKEGGDGGPFRDSEVTIRELHFSKWKDSDFQILLEALGETPVIDDDEWDLKFGHERNWLSKLFTKGGRPQ